MQTSRVLETRVTYSILPKLILTRNAVIPHAGTIYPTTAHFANNKFAKSIVLLSRPAANDLVRAQSAIQVGDSPSFPCKGLVL